MLKLRFSVLVLLVGCSGAVDGSSTSTSSEKLAAADARSRGESSEDACAAHGWYGDDVCDSFCARQDADCVAKPSEGEPIVCAQFIESKNGVCGRTATDPCRFQDPDCDAPTAGTGSDEGTVCAAIIELPDDVCRRPASDPCRAQDPDCVPPPSGGEGGSTSTGGSRGWPGGRWGC